MRSIRRIVNLPLVVNVEEKDEVIDRLYDGPFRSIRSSISKCSTAGKLKDLGLGSSKGYISKLSKSPPVAVRKAISTPCIGSVSPRSSAGLVQTFRSASNQASGIVQLSNSSSPL